MKDWLDSVNKMATLNEVVDFHLSENVIQALAYAYHVNFTPIEAVAFIRLVANKINDDDLDKVREIEARARDLTLLAKPDGGYKSGLVRKHVSRFVNFATEFERQPEATLRLVGGL